MVKESLDKSPEEQSSGLLSLGLERRFLLRALCLPLPLLSECCLSLLLGIFLLSKGCLPLLFGILLLSKGCCLSGALRILFPNDRYRMQGNDILHFHVRQTLFDLLVA